jgi:hypothetical protein
MDEDIEEKIPMRGQIPQRSAESVISGRGGGR